MKKPVQKLIFALSILLLSSSLFASTITVSGDITTNTTWTSDNVYILSGFVYVKSGATLTINEGTLIKGDKTTKGTLIITSTGKINAVGTNCNPIVFTSNQPVDNREPGDWGGVIILGNAPINLKDSLGNSIRGVIEGGVDNSAGDGKYGGTNATESSGTLQYIRIEYPGIAFVTNNEINGITFGGVGSGTVVDHIQVSYSGDDSYEFFGGTVNAKYLVAIGTTDDDFDTDFGYSGKCQFLLAVRDSSYYDVAGASNGFESDNDGSGTANTPLTSPVFSNVTLIGPKATLTTPVASYFKRGMHIRKRSNLSVYNSVVMGWPIGEFIESSTTQANFTSGTAEIKNNVWAGCNVNHAAAFDSTFVPSTPNANTFYAAATGAMLTDPFNLSNVNAMPATGSPLLTGASYTASNLSSTFFDKTGTYIGAFGTTNWMDCWTNFDPQNSPYTSVVNIPNVASISIYPNPSNGLTSLNINNDKNVNMNINLLDINGRVITNLFDGTMNAGSNSVAINTANLQRGLYIVNVLSDNNTATYKLVVE